MDKSVATAIMIGSLPLVVTVISTALTYYFNRERDREADLRKIQIGHEADLGKIRLDHEAEWRKLKLQSYSEYFTAMSDARLRPSDAAARSRYIGAVNKLPLVAPPKVLSAFYPYQDYSSIPSPTREQTELIKSLAGAFLRAIREDCHPPGSPKDEAGFEFKFYVLPPELAVGGGQTTELQKTGP